MGLLARPASSAQFVFDSFSNIASDVNHWTIDKWSGYNGIAWNNSIWTFSSEKTEQNFLNAHKTNVSATHKSYLDRMSQKSRKPCDRPYGAHIMRVLFCAMDAQWQQSARIHSTSRSDDDDAKLESQNHICRHFDRLAYPYHWYPVAGNCFAAEANFGWSENTKEQSNKWN